MPDEPQNGADTAAADGRDDTAPQGEHDTFPQRGTPAPREGPLDAREHARLRLATKAKLFGGEGNTRIGRYRVERPIGAGGMGVVYLAYDDDLDRKVAVKVLRTRDSEGSQGQRRLVREAKALAKLSHPNVVHVYEVGRTEEDVFVAMEFIQGNNLRTWTENGRRSWQEVLERHIEAGRGLAAAHRVGLVHRDYKPENVLVGDDGRSRVVDFGLARPDLAPTEVAAHADTLDPAQSPVDEELSLTQTGALIGTPAYMAPEQLAGKAVDARCDQFAFCVALFEGLYGERPFTGKTLAELSANVLRGEPLRVDSSRYGLPPAAHAAIVKGLARDPGDRYPNMEALLDALAGATKSRKSRGLAIVLGSLLLAGSAIGAWVWGNDPEPQVSRDESRPDERRARILENSALPQLLETALPQDPFHVTVHRLSNGLTVYVSPDREAPRIAAFFVVRAGYAHEESGGTGVAHLLEHMMYKGTDEIGALDFEKERPLLQRRDELAAELAQTEDSDRRQEILGEIQALAEESVKYTVPSELQELISDLGADLHNGWTADGSTTFGADIASPWFEVWAEVTAEQMRDPVFRGFFTELGTVVEEYRNSLNGLGTAYIAMQEALFEGTRQAKNPLGTPEDLSKPPLPQMRAFYERYYVPNNSAIILVGDITAERALPVLEEHFGTWQPKPLPDPLPPVEPLPPGRVAKELPYVAPYDLSIGWRDVSRTAKETRAMEALVELLQTSVLERELVDTGLCSFAAIGDAGDALLFFASPREGVDLGKIEAALVAQLEALRAGTVDPMAIETALAARESRRIATRRSAIATAQLIAMSFAEGRAWSDDVEAWQEGALTPQMISDAAARLLDQGRVVVRRSNEPFVPGDLDIPAISGVDLPPRGRSEYAKELGLRSATPLEPQFLVQGRQYQLESRDGRVLITSEVDDGRFDLYLALPFGVLDDPLACDAVWMWIRGGTAKRTADERRRILGRYGIEIEHECDEQRTWVLIRGLARDRDEAWPVVLDWLEHGAPTEEDLARERGALLAQENIRRTLPQWQEHMLWEFAAYGEQSLERLRASRKTVESVSAVDLNEVLDRVRGEGFDALYGGPDPGPPLPRWEVPDTQTERVLQNVELPAKPTVVLLDDGAASRPSIRITFSRPPSSTEDAIWADLLERYAGGHMTSVLYREVREARGLTYAVQADVHRAPDAGNKDLLVVSLAPKPERTVEAIELVLEILRREVGEDRFERARDSLETQYRSRRVPSHRIPGEVWRWRQRGFDSDPMLQKWGRLSALQRSEFEDYLRSFTDNAPLVTIHCNTEQLDIEQLEQLGRIRRVGLADLGGS